MKTDLYEEVSLNRDIIEANLLRGDVAVLIDYVSHPSGGETGAVLEVFNAVGESLSVVTVPVSAVMPLKRDQMPTVRELALAV